MKNRIIILVQEYKKNNSLVYCANLSDPSANFTLHKNYIEAFDNPPKIDSAYLVDHWTKPSECGNFTDHGMTVITKLSLKDAISMTM